MTLQDVDLAWPEPGDRLFLRAALPQEEALQETRISMRLFALPLGYFLLAESGIRNMGLLSPERDLYAPAVIFNFRQFLELSLKSVLHEFGPVVGVTSNWKSHQLNGLVDAFMRLLEQHGIACAGAGRP